MAKPFAPRPSQRLAFAMIVGLVVGGFVYFYTQFKGFLSPPSSALAAQWDEETIPFAIVPVYLMPSSPLAEATHQKALEAWRDLWSNMPQDAASQQLLKRLYADAPVRIDANFKDEADPLRPLVPAAADEQPPTMIELHAKHADAKDALFSGLLEGQRKSRTRRAVKNEPLGQLNAVLGSAPKGKPDDAAALLLAANDYLIRKQPRWRLVDGRGVLPADVKIPKQTLAERRADLNLAVDQYLSRFDVPK
ncbi:MAG: hypothetical protein K2R98_31505 [Gemmataceae bacterium]|nr:hypothetical protein [Gemmataceae bacterium]